MQQSLSLIQRQRLLFRLNQLLQEAPVTVLLGARQTGKTTLAKIFAESVEDHHFFDLEKASDRNALTTPELTLNSLKGTVIIDEIQRMPQLFEVLRPLSDRVPLPARFLLLGSASPTLVRGVSETLAGRALFLPVPGFCLDEVGCDEMERLWQMGSFPRSFLAAFPAASLRWREAFISTFLERDIPQLGIRVPPETLRRFWTMLAHYHGQRWNASELARSLNASEKTTKHYLDILCGTYVVRSLPPWHENLGKRQVKSPKVYVRDSGLLHALLGIQEMVDLRRHPKYGASWEGFALEQILARLGERNAYFWGTQRGAELDLLVLRRGRRYGFEFKCSDAPAMTRSLHVARTDLHLERAWIIYPGTKRYAVHETVEALPLAEIETALDGLEEDAI